MNTFLMISRFMNKTFALWVVVFGALGFVFPQVFKPVGAYVSILLGVVMFGMGLTLTTADFREIFRRPKDVAVGILAQFLIMPLAAFVLCKAFDLPPDLAVGLMLLGCVPGGTASNVVTFLARGDVALSVTVTSCTTLLAPVVTPALMYAFASQWLSIDPTAMFMSIVQVILVPIAAGVIVHKIFGAKVERVAAVLPIVSVGAVVVIVAAVVAATRSQILSAGMTAFIVVALQNAFGMALGFAADQREYYIGAQILRDLGVKSMRLLTNNPDKLYQLAEFGMHINSRVPIQMDANTHDLFYLRTKQKRMGHLVNY